MSSERREQLALALFAMPATVFMFFIMAVPLFGMLWQSVQGASGPTLSVYLEMARSSLFLRVFWTTVEIAAGATAIALFIGYVVAYFLSRKSARSRSVWLIFVLIPFWTSALVKSFAFTVILGRAGLVNTILLHYGLSPVKLLFDRTGVMIGMSHYLLPFVIFPILTNLLDQPADLKRAAAIMGASKLRIFTRVTLPLSLPGVMSGALIGFILALGFYVIPALLGGRKDMMLSNLVDFYAREVADWRMASAVAVVLIATSLLATVLLSKVRGGTTILSKDPS